MERTYSKETITKIGEKIILKGWVFNSRNHGQLVFIDFWDTTGIVQVVVNKGDFPEAFEVAITLGKQWVVEIEGEVKKRDDKLINKNLATGTVEIVAEKILIVNQCKELPFPLDTDGRELDENLRFKYRFLDLRRERIARIVHQKHDWILAIRNWLSGQGFTEVSTPLLTTTSPEGARDFIIPSRVHKGKFFVLPQAPQQFKQLLMVGGLDKYFQIAPCMRDEDPRADRHAGAFYQVDMEMSFPTRDKIFWVCENLLKDTYQTVAPGKRIKTFPFPQIRYSDCLEKYGTDKPDVRFSMELIDLTGDIKGKTESILLNDSEAIKVVVAPGCASWSDKETEKMESFAKEKGAKGLMAINVEGGKLTGGAMTKFIPESLHSSIIQTAGAKDGDLLFVAAGKRKEINKILGAVRSRLGELLNLTDSNELACIWITDFPFYDIDEKTGKLDFGHNPFSMPKGGIKAFETKDPLTIESYQYDLAVNGYEILSGSIRNHEPETLVKAFETIGYTRDTVLKRFGGMYNAFQYGAPPHGGWAIGLDRLFMVFIDEPNIRDVYAFPLNSNGVDMLMNAPSEVDPKQLEECGIMLRPELVEGLKLHDQLIKLLDDNGVVYQHLEHEEVETSDQAAKVRGTRLDQGAKALIFATDKDPVLAVLPASQKLDEAKLKAAIGTNSLRLAAPAEVQKIAGVPIGAVPPFGNLFGVSVVVDPELLKNEEIAFNTGSRRHSVIMKSADFVRLVNPKQARLIV